MTIVLRTLDELIARTSATLPLSEAITVDQAMVDQFALTTNDPQWIHVDVARATAEFGHTIAHGMLTLSLLIPLVRTVYRVDAPSVLNYGFDRVRFIAPVPTGSTLRAACRIVEVSPSPRGTKVTTAATIFIGSPEDRVCIADWLTFFPSFVSGAAV